MPERKIPEKSFKEIVDSVDVFSFMSVQDLLSHIYNELKKHLPRYSYRSFSSDLGFGETNYLHLICTQKRQLSVRSAQQVVSRLGLHAERRTWFLSLVEHTAGRHTAQRAEGIRKAYKARQRTIDNTLTRDEMEFFGSWYHPVIRELVGRKDFSAEPRWICQRLRPKITLEQARQSIELLLRLGTIELRDDGTYQITDTHIHVPEGVNHLTIHKYHQEMLHLSERSLSEVDASERDLSAVTVLLSKSQVAEVKALLRETRKKILALSEKSEHAEDKQIYQMNMQLFPVTGQGR
jgi:uncharacterized protein (TIGR02147 family)